MSDDVVRWEPVPDEDFGAWRDGVVSRLAGQRVTAGVMTDAVAREHANGLLDRLLPDPHHHPLRAYRGTAVIADGWLWAADGEAFLFDVAVPDAADGGAVMRAVEAEARRLGATVLRLNVFHHDRAMLGLAAGYGPAVTQMLRRLTGPAQNPDRAELTGPTQNPDRAELTEPAQEPDRTGNAGPAGNAGRTVTLRTMTPAQFAAYRQGQESAYAAELVRADLVSPAEAVRRADAEMADLLPDGLDSADRLLLTAYDGDTEVGYVCLSEESDGDATHAFVFDVEVPAALRRRGYGRAIMLAAERLCLERGAVSLGLSVFGFNDGARALYEQLGYEAVETIVRTRFAPAGSLG